MEKQKVNSIYELHLADLCLPDYFSGDHRPVIAIPVDGSTRNHELKEELVSEISAGYFSSGFPGSPRFYREAKNAVLNFFADLDGRKAPFKKDLPARHEIDESEECDVYAYFILERR